MEITAKRIDVLRPFAVGACFLLVLAATGCAGTLRGQVLDAQTGQPIAGAVVLGVWTKGGGVPGFAHTDPVGVREAETDGEGWFELEGVSGWLLDEKAITIYKFGYVAWSNQFIFPTFTRRKDTQVPAKIRLDAFPLGGDHRRHIDFISDATWSGLSSRVDRPKFNKTLERERELL